MSESNAVIKPMLSAVWPHSETAQHEILDKWAMATSPKIDGMRCLLISGQGGQTRSGKSIPNVAVSAWLLGIARGMSETLRGRDVDGVIALDGELVVGPVNGGDQVWGRTTSRIMSPTGGIEDVHYYIFDAVVGKKSAGWMTRMNAVRQWIEAHPDDRLNLVTHRRVQDPNELSHACAGYVADGYEGAMVRHVGGLYKHGRATVPGGQLYKIKGWRHDEGVIMGAEELLVNTNHAVRNEVGRVVRSSRKVGMVPGGMLGALILSSGIRLGTGMTSDERLCLWKMWKEGALKGREVRYKYLEGVSGGRVRHPVYVGLRGFE